MSATRLARWNTPLVHRIALYAFALIALAFAAVAIANALLPNKTIKDYELWFDTGQQMLHGEDIYPLKRKLPFMYPPTAAVLLAPVSMLGRTGLVVALAALTAAAWLASILLSVRLATGKPGRQHLLLYVVPSLVVLVYVWSNFHIGQPSIVLLALMLGAFVALQGKRQWLAGALIALAAGIKAFPFIAIVYLLYRRYWIAAASLLLTLVFLLLILPAPLRGFARAGADLQQWSQRMLFKYDEKGVAQRPGRSNSWKNQSIFGLANRMLRHVDAGDQTGERKASYANVADLSFTAVNAVILASGLILGLVFLGVMPRAAARTPDSDGIEFALLILLMLLFTPLAFGYLFVWLLFPFTVALERLMQQPNRSLGVCALFSIALLALALLNQRPAQTYGNTFFATLVLFVGLALELRRLKRA